MNKLFLEPFENEINAKITLPASKSITNRMFILSSMANGISKLRNYLKSEDTEIMINALKKLGIKIEIKGEDAVIYGNTFNEKNREIYLSNSGTSVRFLTALATIINGQTRIYGKNRMHERPIKDLVESLNNIGGKIQYEKKEGFPPLIINGNKNIEGKNCEISGKISSQFITAIMNIACKTKNGIKLKIITPLVSKPYLDISIDVLKKFGINVKQISKLEYHIKNQEIQPVDIKVEGDASACSHILSLAMAKKGKIEIDNLTTNSYQGDIKCLDFMKKMGAGIKNTKNGFILEMKKDLQPLGNVDFENIPDGGMSIIVLCGIAKGYSKITGLSTLKNKECNRLQVIHDNFEKLGIQSKIDDDSIEVFGSDNIKNNIIETHDDHRIAMSFACIGAVKKGVTILDPNCVEKTYPNFWQDFEKLRK